MDIDNNVIGDEQFEVESIVGSRVTHNGVSGFFLFFVCQSFDFTYLLFLMQVEYRLRWRGQRRGYMA